MMPGPGHASFCGNEGPHEQHRHPLPDSYEVCGGREAPPPLHPGHDWRDVPEGTRLTGAQQAARFLTFTQAEQVAFMEGRENLRERAMDCMYQNHFGAVYYATHHSCKTQLQRKLGNSRQLRNRRRQVIRKGRKA